MFEKIINFPRKAMRRLKSKSFTIFNPKLASAEPHFRQAKKNLANGQFSEALELLIRVLIIAPRYPEAGRHVRKTILSTKGEQRIELRESFRKRLLGCFNEVPSASANIEQMRNHFFVLVALEEWLLAHRVCNNNEHLQKSLKEIGKLWSTINAKCLSLPVDTVGKVTYLSCIQELTKDVSSLIVYRRVIAQAFRKLFAHEHAVGTPTNLNSPLLDPATFLKFVEARQFGSLATRIGEDIVGHLQSIQTQSGVNYSASGDVPKILFVSDSNWHFVKPIVESFEARGANVRFLPFTSCEVAIDAQSSRNEGASMHEHLYGLGPAFISPEEARRNLASCAPWANDLIDWADIVFVEWWNRPAVWMSRYLKPGKRLVIRCHSYEAFTPLPHFSNMKRIDGAIFIAEHIKSVFENVFEDTVTPNFNAVVIQNIRDRPIEFIKQKPSDAKFTLGMMQYADKNKDPLFALQILQNLIESDRRWKIKFVGRAWKRSEIASDLKYQDDFLQMVAKLGRHVEIDEFTDNPQEWHKTIGYIVSASYREGSHESVADGMATGAIPIIRRWPMVKDFGAPNSVYPGLQFFDTPVVAANYILQNAENFEAHSQTSRDWVASQQDIETSKEQMWQFVVNGVSDLVRIGRRH